MSAIGRPRYESEYAVLGMVLNIAGTLALAPFFGLYGILGGTAFGVITCSLYFLWRFHRLLGLSLWDYLGRWLCRLVAGTSLAAAAVLGLRMAIPADVASSRGKGALALIALGAIYAVLMLVALRMVRFLEARDLAVVKRVLPTRLQSLATLPAVEFLFGART